MIKLFSVEGGEVLTTADQVEFFKELGFHEHILKLEKENTIPNEDKPIRGRPSLKSTK